MAKKRDLTSVQDALNVAASRAADPASSKVKEVPKAESEGHQRLTTGYIKADGTEMKRRSLMLTETQSKRLDVACAMAGYGGNISAFVVDKLKLDG